MNLSKWPLPKDPHSYYEPGMPKAVQLRWTAGIDFDAKRVRGAATYTFDVSGPTFLDTWELEILSITSGNDMIPFVLGPHHKVKGTSLSFTVPESKVVTIDYLTSKDPEKAKGIQWLPAELCNGKPFVYTQGEAINARSYLPCQDTPSIKLRVRATIIVPKGLRGLIAAPELIDYIELDTSTVETWNIDQPIPSYLITFAVGDLVKRQIADRLEVWAQPHVIDAAANEFRDLPTLMEAGEKLFGPYRFGKYGVLVMPAAFPYGGMENPCLSFVTPALLAGDGSGVSTVTHELAHSWTGNLVTNANWDAFYLNEGWTVLAEHLITTLVEGREDALVLLKLLEREFLGDCDNFRKEGRSFLQKLAPGADTLDPDAIFSRVSYFRSCLLLLRIRQEVGEERFAEFIRTYIETFAFLSLTSETFVDFCRQQLGDHVVDAINMHAWIYEEELPADAPIITCDAIVEIQGFASGPTVPPADIGWSTSRLQLYIELLPRTISSEFIKQLDEEHQLSTTLNTELRWSFLVLAIKSGYKDVLPYAGELLQTQGRKKYLEPLYRALYETSWGREFADQIFEGARANYHPVVTSKIEEIRQTTVTTEFQ